MTRQRLLGMSASCLAILALVFASWAFRLPTETSSLPEHFRASASVRTHGLVDDRRCVSCHDDVHQTYMHSGMCQSWKTWKDAQPIEDRREGSHEVIVVGDLRYQVVIENGRMFQREFLIADGNELELNRREAHYVLGSGTKGRTYISSENGYLTQLPISWYSQAKRWDISPGYRSNNLRFNRPIRGECVDCHNAEPIARPGSQSAFAEPMPNGISCQRCHGPGGAHIAFQETGKGSDSMIVISKLSPSKQQDVCLQCHLIGDYQIPPVSGAKAFTPGDDLKWVRADFFRLDQGSQFQAAGHGPRSMASRCYTESGGKMTCVLCHDPHRPAATSRKVSITRCQECHAQTKCGRPLKNGELPESGDCVSCHMPKRESHDISHATATEHWIHVPGKLKDTEAPFPLPTEKKFSVAPFWSGTDHRQQLLAELAHQLAMRREDRLEPVTGELKKSIGKIVNPEYHIMLARSLALQKKTAESLDAWKSAAALAPDRIEPRQGLAETYRQMGDAARGLLELERGLARNPWHETSDGLLLDLLVESRLSDKSLTLWNRYLKFHPRNADILLRFSDIRRREGASDAEFFGYLSSAEQADGFRAEPFQIRSILAVQRHDLNEALRQVQSAVARQPRSISNRLLLARIRQARSEWGDARKLLLEILHDEPNHYDARTLLKELDGAP